MYFSQKSVPYCDFKEDGTVYLMMFGGIPARVEVAVNQVMLGDIPVLKAVIPPFDLTQEELLSTNVHSLYMAQGEIWLFWSDGDSVLTLGCPGWMTDEQITELPSTLYVEENIDALPDALR